MKSLLTYINESKESIINSQKFKDWFGDWSDREHTDYADISKVCDKNDKPLIVYHGSLKKFDNFEAGHEGIRGKGDDTEGFYFALSEDVARNYGPNITKAYLDIKMPFYARKYEEVANLNKRKIEKLKRSGCDGAIYEATKHNDTIAQYEFVVFDKKQIWKIN